jgi:hypothetical protein
MIKAPLLIRLLKQRLTHNEAYLAQTPRAAASLGLPVDDMSENDGYRKAIEEENEFLRVVLKEVK